MSDNTDKKPISSAEIERQLREDAPLIYRLKIALDEATAERRKQQAEALTAWKASHGELQKAETDAALAFDQEKERLDDLLEMYRATTGKQGEILDGLYTLTESTKFEIEDEAEFIHWVITNHPGMAPDWFKVDTAAVEKHVTPLCKNGELPEILKGMPAKFVQKIGKKFGWSKMEKLEGEPAPKIHVIEKPGSTLPGITIH